MSDLDNIRIFFERIANFTNNASKEVSYSAVPYSHIVQIGLTVNSALAYIDELRNKHLDYPPEFKEALKYDRAQKEYPTKNRDPFQEQKEHSAKMLARLNPTKTP